MADPWSTKPKRLPILIPTHSVQLAGKPQSGATMLRHSALPGRSAAAWVNFSGACFAASLLLVGGGIFTVPLDWTVRGYFAAGLAILVVSSFFVAKTMRDLHDTNRMISRIGHGRTEQLLRVEQP